MMKQRITWMAAAGLLLPVGGLVAQNPAPNPEPPKFRGKPEREMEKVAFLGVAVSPAAPSLRAQLGIPEGTGLLVVHVEPDSAAVGKLEDYDVLTRFNDQVLVNQEQLTVLVASAGIGAEVKLTVIRKKSEQTVAVTLGQREVPKGAWAGWAQQFGYGEWAPGCQWNRRHEDILREMKEKAGELRERAEERLKDARERREQRQAAPAGPPAPESGKGQPGKQSVVKHSTWVEDGLVLNLMETGEGKRLTVEKGGQKVFEGPVDTEEQRQKVPEEFRGKLDKMTAEPAVKESKKTGDIL